MNKILDKLPFACQSWFVYLRFLVRHYVNDGCTQKAASLTYTTLLSLVPIVTVMLVMFSSIPALEGVREQVQWAIYRNLMPSSGEVISQYISSFAEKSSNLGIIGVTGVFVTTIMTLITIETAFNQIWRVAERSGGMASVVRYWAMITAAPIILGIAFGASSAISGLSFLNQKIAGYGIDFGVWARIISFVLMAGGFIALYQFIPKTKVPIKNAVIAGVVIAVLFEVLKSVFGMVMTNFTSYEAIYGAFAAIPVFLMWLYLSWNLILLGVEISYTLTIFGYQEVSPKSPILVLLDMLHLAYERHQVGETVSEADFKALLGRGELPKWHQYLDKLIHLKLIARTQNDEFILKMDLGTMSVWQFYNSMSYALPTEREMMNFCQTNHEQWSINLAHHVGRVENATKEQLQLTLAQLFGNQQAKLSDNTDTTQKTDDVPTPPQNNRPIKAYLTQILSTIKDKLPYKTHHKDMGKGDS